MFNHIQVICLFMNTLPVLCFPFKGFCRFKFLVIPLIILSYTFYWKKENIWSCVLVTIYIIVLVLQGVVSECMKLSYSSPTEEKWHFFFFHEWKILTKFLHELIIRSIDHFTTKTYQSDVKHHKQSRSKHFTKLKSLTKLQCMKTILSTFCIHVQSRDNNWSFIKIR